MVGENSPEEQDKSVSERVCGVTVGREDRSEGKGFAKSSVKGSGGRGGGLCRCQGPRSAGGDRVGEAGLGSPSGKKWFSSKAPRKEKREEASGVLCL